MTAFELNEDVAGRLEEIARLLAAQGANAFRVRAYQRAADTVRRLREPISQLIERRGAEALQSLPGIGESMARAIHDVLVHGRMAILERLRGASDPIALLRSVPGIGKTLADRLHHDLGINTLEALEAAAHDGRLEHILGFGPKRLAGIRDSLAHRLSRVRASASSPNTGDPPVEEILSVDREYREKAATERPVKIAPRRFNLSHTAWLPILHTERGSRQYTAYARNGQRGSRKQHHDEGQYRRPRWRGSCGGQVPGRKNNGGRGGCNERRGIQSGGVPNAPPARAASNLGAVADGPLELHGALVHEPVADVRVSHWASDSPAGAGDGPLSDVQLGVRAATGQLLDRTAVGVSRLEVHLLVHARGILAEDRLHATRAAEEVLPGDRRDRPKVRDRASHTLGIFERDV
jgi:hypothetical protein